MFDGDSNWYWVCHNFSTILRLRALFGVAMGGLFGICAAEALGDAPKRPEGCYLVFSKKVMHLVIC